MAIRCSLFGHDWGESHVERKREEGDAEVVVTVREVRVCGRCNDRDVLSENVEVTALSEESTTAHETGGEREGHVIEDAETGEQTVVSVEQSDGATTETDDGAVILDDETADRESGEWPEQQPGPAGTETDHRRSEETAKHEDAGSAKQDHSADMNLGHPTTDEAETTADEMSSSPTEPPSEPIAEEADEVEIIDEEPGVDTPSASGPATDAGSETARTSETTEAHAAVDGAGGDSSPPAGADKRGESIDGSVWVGDDSGTNSAGTEMGLVVQCPNCGFVDEEAAPSLRGGDSCPNCRAAYLRER